MGAGNNWQPADPEVGRLRDRLLAGEAALAARVYALEGQVAAWQTRETLGHTERRTRVWQIALAVVTGLVLPVGLVGILALLHLGG